jgi:myo-inositol-1(or 4)-monophosphatase
VTDWLAVCREAVEDVRAVLEELPTRVEREPVVGDGMGGDETTAIDAAAEEVILARLQAVEGTTIVSEEAGVVGDGSTRVVVDPIDGSLNAKRGIPFFSVSIAVADGGTMDDVYFGYVYDFGSGEEWVAEKNLGVRLNGAVLASLPPKEEIEILSFEATLTSSISEKAAAMVGLAYRLRVMGSLALSLCHLAAGRVDAVCSLKPARAWTSPRRSSSSARRAWRSSSPRRRPSARRRSTSRGARAWSRPRRQTESSACSPRCRGEADPNRLLRLELRNTGGTASSTRHACPRAWLDFYADHFDTVEVNSTFYRLPKETAVANWVRESPPASSSR